MKNDEAILVLYTYSCNAITVNLYRSLLLADIKVPFINIIVKLEEKLRISVSQIFFIF